MTSQFSSLIGRFLPRCSRQCLHRDVISWSEHLEPRGPAPSKHPSAFPLYVTRSTGEGDGRGGGAGGPIRSSGGAFGKREAAEENKYFREEQARQIAELKDAIKSMHEEKIAYHKRQMARHLESIEKHKELQKTDEKPRLRDVNIRSHQEAVNTHKEAIANLQRKTI